MAKTYPVPNLLSRALGRISWRHAECLYLLSSGRTGTTALAKVLNCHPRFQAYHELAPLGAMTYRDILLSYSDSPARFRQYFVKHRAGVIGAVHRSGRIFAETNNFQFYAPIISDILPKSKFVFVHRHPAEYVRSGMRRGWYVNHPWDSFRLHPSSDDPASQLWPTWSQFEKICWFWDKMNRFFLEFRASQPAERILTIAFDELVQPQTGAYRALFECMELNPPAEQDVGAVLDAKVNAQETGDFPKYGDWTSEQVQRLHEIAGDTMSRLGYQ